ncbi:GTP-binding protein rhoA [Mycena venus]|uniref:GTP-binding protein rhoA n=1 Tax=Mycena venus TaxID=2733690 RepID=A0A8H6XR02_9AGAR|nr:GTP-binding protein rhoA [Mycena venus]
MLYIANPDIDSGVHSLLPPQPDSPLLQSTMSMLRRKLVVVGDGACGKTSLLTVFTHNVFLEILPGVIESYVAILEVSSQLIEFGLWDTLWQDEYDRLRPLAYPDAHVILICFAVDYPVSLDNVRDKVGPGWVPEVRHFGRPDLPFIVVGCKTDLCQDPPVSAAIVATEEGRELARIVGAHKYMECSAKLGQGVREVFEEAAAAALCLTPVGGMSRFRSRSRGCIVL